MGGNLLGCSVGFVRINGLFHLLINEVYWGYNPLILTSCELPTGHPGKTTSLGTSKTFDLL